MIGASGAISGLMGATMRFLFNALDHGGFRRLREAPQSVPLMPLEQALTDKRVLLATAIWLLLNVVAVLGIGAEFAPGGIAWEAHVGGYAVGFLTFGAFDVQLRNEKPDKHTMN
jgi:membrane associated rhomboid family serine protease